MGRTCSKPKKQTDVDVSPEHTELFKIYALETIIACGSYGDVWKARQRYLPAKEVAIKFVATSNSIIRENVVREILILRKLDHPNLTCFYDAFSEPNRFAIVMEYIAGGDLLTRVTNKGFFPEFQAKCIVLQILDGIEFLHSMGIVHLDIKPDNILCSDTDDPRFYPFRIIISDFGLSRVSKHGELLTTRCGSEEYAAPEIMFRNTGYRNSVDLWSCGVTAFAIVCGTLPFVTEDGDIDYERIRDCSYDYLHGFNNSVSMSCSRFIDSLLQLVPENRPSAKIAKLDPWLE